MNFTKNIIIGILFLYCTNMNSQTTSSYLNTNIQQHILNKYWSNELATTGKTVVFPHTLTKKNLGIHTITLQMNLVMTQQLFIKIQQLVLFHQEIT